MLFKKLCFFIALILCFSNLIASEINKFPPNANQQKELDENKQTQQTAASRKNNDVKENQQSKTDKKPNMVDYCRKNTC